MAAPGIKISPIGRFVLAHRQAKNWGRNKLAREAGIDPSTIQNIETGRTQGVRSDQFDGLAKVFGYEKPEEFKVAISDWAAANPANDAGEVALMIPPDLAALIRERAEAEGVKVADLLATWLATMPRRRKRKGA